MAIVELKTGEKVKVKDENLLEFLRDNVDKIVEQKGKASRRMYFIEDSDREVLEESGEN
jgi:hypothetical protein